METGGPLASVSRVGKQFASRDGSRVVALDDVSFEVAQGAFLTIVG